MSEKSSFKETHAKTTKQFMPKPPIKFYAGILFLFFSFNTTNIVIAKVG